MSVVSTRQKAPPLVAFNRDVASRWTAKKNICRTAGPSQARQRATLRSRYREHTLPVLCLLRSSVSGPAPRQSQRVKTVGKKKPSNQNIKQNKKTQNKTSKILSDDRIYSSDSKTGRVLKCATWRFRGNASSRNPPKLPLLRYEDTFTFYPWPRQQIVWSDLLVIITIILFFLFVC